MPMLVSAGSISRHATSPSASRRSRASTSLKGTTRGRQGHVDLRAHGSGPGHDPVALEHGQGLVDGAVVAPVEHRDPRSPGQVPGEPEHEPVGVGRRHRELPAREPEPAAQLLGHPDRVLRRQHRGDALGGALGDGGRDLRQRVAGHRAGVAQAQVDVLDAVDVREPRPGGRVHEHRERAGPPRHPRHRYAGQQRPGARSASAAERGWVSTKRRSSVSRSVVRRSRSIRGMGGM